MLAGLTAFAVPATASAHGIGQRADLPIPLSLFVFQGQASFFLISDPLGDGSDIFGTSEVAIDYSVLSANAIWYAQVAALVLGHVAALVLAHDKALATWSNPRVAIRSQYWMLLVMVAFTCLGLSFLSAAAS